MDEYDNEVKKNNFGSGTFISGFIVSFIFIALMWGIGKSGKYEGQTAEEWFNEYDSCSAQLDQYQSCVEDNFPDVVYQCSP